MEKLKQALYLNLIKDDRWQYLTGGLKNTLIITLFAALIGISSQKGFDSTMTVRKGSAITTPKYKNLDEWSLDDLLVLLGSIGGLLGFK